MSLDKENKCCGDSSNNEQGCCGDNKEHKHENKESCCGGNGHEHGEGGCCGGDHDHDHGDGCGCGGHDHEHHQSITLTLEDDTELDCPIVDAFEINEQGYIALLHPVEETVILYRFFDNDDETIDIENIEDDDEFELVSKTFLSLQEED